MTEPPPPIQLAGATLGQHRHVGLFFNGTVSEDRVAEDRVIGPFVREGIARGEKVLTIVDPAQKADCVRRLQQAGIDTTAAERQAQLEVRTWADTGQRDGRFDQDTTLAFIEASIVSARQQGFARTRIVGHMAGVLQAGSRSDQLVAFEERLNALLARHDDPVLCLYDTAQFAAGIVLEILRTHPLVIIGGELRANPLFIPPAAFLREQRGEVAKETERADFAAPSRLRAAPATRAALLAAARRQFAIGGYDRTSVRGIAKEVGVDAALVIRYFGSKRALFVESLGEVLDVAPFLAGPIETLGERLVHYVYALWTEPGLLSVSSLLRSTSDPQAVEWLRNLARTYWVPSLAAVLGGDDAELRAELIWAQLVGCGVLRNIVETPGLRHVDLDRLIASLAPAIQACITPAAHLRREDAVAGCGSQPTVDSPRDGDRDPSLPR